MAKRQSANQTITKTQFLADLRTHITTLKGDYESLGREIRKEQSNSQTLGERRKALLDGLTVQLLPDLSPKHLSVLNGSLPFIPTPERVAELNASEMVSLAREQARLCAGYNPATYDADVAALDTELGVHEAKVQEINEIFATIPGLETLYRKGYGTSDYGAGIFDLEYYRDWSRGDEILDELKMSSWGEVTEYARGLDEQKGIATNTLGALRVKKTQLKSTRDNYLDIEKRSRAIGSVILERLQVELRAGLDTYNGEIVGKGLTAEIMSVLCHVRELATNIEKVEGIIRGELQPMRQKIMQEVTKLEQLYAVAERSRAATLPANTVGLAPAGTSRLSRSVRSRGSSGTGATYNHYHYDSGNDFVTYLFYDQMLHHFQSAPAPVQVVREVERVPEYRQPSDYDRYGRVS